MFKDAMKFTWLVVAGCWVALGALYGLALLIAGKADETAQSCPSGLICLTNTGVVNIGAAAIAVLLLLSTILIAIGSLIAVISRRARKNK